MDDPDEHWEPVSGWAPLIEAAARLAAVRRAIPAVAAMSEKLIQDAHADATEHVARIRDGPEASAYISEAEMLAEDEIYTASTELPRMFFAQVVVYLLSILESALADCLGGVAENIDRVRLLNVGKRGDCGSGNVADRRKLAKAPKPGLEWLQGMSRGSCRHVSAVAGPRIL